MFYNQQDAAMEEYSEIIGEYCTTLCDEDFGQIVGDFANEVAVCLNDGSVIVCPKDEVCILG